ncbi:MAG: PEGA domain-containing protein [Methanoregula sp.]
MTAQVPPLLKKHLKSCHAVSSGLFLLVALVAVPLIMSNASAEYQNSVNPAFNLTVLVIDNQTRANIGQALVYFDGAAEGSTSDIYGSLLIPGVRNGQHSVRIKKLGFDEITKIVNVQADMNSTITLSPSKITPIFINGPPEEKIDVVFVPSDTEYDGDTNQKLPANDYTSNRTAFESDVNNLIANYFRLDTITSPTVGLPADYRDRFNFYYYWDDHHFADAFEGCAGTLPDHFWEDAPFADAAIIVYPKYIGRYAGPPSQPDGCGMGLGLGTHSWAKVPGNSDTIFLHESGHAIWGLVDTFCGVTDYYTVVNPDPNIWRSEAACNVSATSNHWNSSVCSQITGAAPTPGVAACSEPYWRYDPEPDLMGLGANSESGVFGDASTTRIRYILDNIGVKKA